MSENGEMATLDEIVENSLYTEIKKLRDDISIVMDPSKDKLYLKKVLDVFSVPVFEYLKSHTDIHHSGGTSGKW